MSVDWAALQRATGSAFGDPVTYAPRSAPAFDGLSGIFNRFQTVATNIDGAPIAVMKTTLLMQAADFRDRDLPQQGDRVVINRVTYDVVIADPDGFGGVLLTLGVIG